MIISTDALTWDAKTATFTSEASDDPEAGSRLVSWRGNPPMKITLRNPKTGGTREFRFVRTAVTDDGEILGWEWSCPSPRMRMFIRND